MHAVGARQKATMGSPLGKWASPGQKKYIHPALNSVGFRPGEPQWLGMLLDGHWHPSQLGSKSNLIFWYLIIAKYYLVRDDVSIDNESLVVT
jgi:hypothetical protein